MNGPREVEQALDDRGDDGVVCTKYATEQEPVDEDQLTLF